MVKVLDRGEVTLLNFMGGDAAVVAAARVSNGETYETASKGLEKDEKLIRYLVKHRHGTPFEHSTFQFYVKAPLFVVREWQRHRIASYNEISGRYVEFEPEFYVPDKLRVPGSSTKQGSAFPDAEFSIAWAGKNLGYDWHEEQQFTLLRAYNEAYDSYTELLENNVAKEMARMVLPLATYTQFYFTINARSLMNFLGLRSGSDAQWEIQQYANAMIDMFKEKMPLTYAAWEDNQRISP